MVQMNGIGKRILMAKEDLEEAKEEVIQCLKTLEGELGDKVYLGGGNIGFVVVVLVPFTTWFYSYETQGNFSIRQDAPSLLPGPKGAKKESA